jgi:excinuclease ABC subunit A
MRLMWARIGRTFCPKCGREMRPDSVSSVTDTVLSLPEGTRFAVAFPLRLSAKVTHAVVVENLRAQGFLRVAIRDRIESLDELPHKTDLARVKDLMVVVDRLAVRADVSSRLAESIGTSFREGDGEVAILLPEGVRSPLDGTMVTRLRFTDRFECANDGTRLPAPTPQLFSFNNPRGACPRCNGFGATLEYDESLVIPYPERTLRDGAIEPWTKPRYDNKRRTLAEFAKKNGIPMDVPWSELSSAQRDMLLNTESRRGYVGVFPFLKALEEKRYKQYIRVFLRQYQTARECPECHGAKLQPESLNVFIGGSNIAQIAELPIDKLSDWLETLELSDYEMAIAEMILREARDRVRFLRDVGLDYLTLNRSTRTLSGGEAQRIGLANSLGSRLVDTLYVLDEPSVGLHARDMDRLLSLLRRLRDAGNTVVVVEHDPAAMEVADYMVELGPGSGGPMSRIAESPLTGKYLSGELSVPLPDERRRVGPRWIALNGAREHNLHGVDVKIPVGALTVVTGVSGSGKSTLVHDVLYHALETHTQGEHSAKRHLGEAVGAYESISGVEAIDDVVMIDQSPIGKSPRSNPVTYIKAMDEIRSIFADTPLARQRKYTPGTFSFNVEGGRCSKCEGAGYTEVEMVFMADVFVPCDDCGGRRFKAPVLEVRVNGKNIDDVLQMTVDQAIRFFAREEKLGQALWHLQQVGLGYLRLGQPATTLSGGEAQRIKIARELASAGRKGGRKLYIMDEPTTGLHLDDIRKLVLVLDRLVAAGHTIVLIEHNLDVIKLADWIIDMGPEGGNAGGKLVAMGRPEDIVKVAESYTGRWLAPLLAGGKPVREGMAASQRAGRATAKKLRAG